MLWTAAVLAIRAAVRAYAEKEAIYDEQETKHHQEQQQSVRGSGNAAASVKQLEVRACTWRLPRSICERRDLANRSL